MLALLMGVIYKVRCSDHPRWHDIYIYMNTKFHDDQFKLLRNIKVITSAFYKVC
jgi:hypothetical protein